MISVSDDKINVDSDVDSEIDRRNEEEKSAAEKRSVALIRQKSLRGSLLPRENDDGSASSGKSKNKRPYDVLNNIDDDLGSENSDEEEDTESSIIGGGGGVANQENFIQPSVTTKITKTKQTTQKRKKKQSNKHAKKLKHSDEVEALRAKVGLMADEEINARAERLRKAGTPVKQPINSHTRTNHNEQMTALEIALLTKQAPPAQPKTAEENLASRQRYEQMASQLRVASLWEVDGPLKLTKCFWPRYSAVDYDVSLCRFDFYLDYLLNMFLIPNSGMTFERKNLLLEYGTNASLHRPRKDDDEEFQTYNDYDVVPDDKFCERRMYEFEEFRFGPAQADNHNFRAEVLRPTASIDDIIGKVMRPSTKNIKKKQSGEEQEGETKKQPKETESLKPVDQLTTDEAAKILKLSVNVYDQPYLTQYEIEHPHSMTALQQRLFIGRLNGIEMMYTQKEIETMPAYLAATKAFGFLDFGQATGWSATYIIQLGLMMSSYILTLFSRIREKADKELVYVYGEEMAKQVHALYASKLRKLNYQVEQFVRLLVTNCMTFQQNNAPAFPEFPTVLSYAIIGTHLCDEEVYAKMSAFQKSIKDFLFKCHDLRLRKCNGVAYKEVFNHEGLRTNSFVEYKKIEELCGEAPNFITSGEKWLVHTESPQMQGWCARYLKDSDIEHFFPWLKRQSFVWSFRNGIYDGEQDKFWEYKSNEIRESPLSPYNRKEASAKYIDKDFDVSLMRDAAMKNPNIIKVKAVDTICDAQNFSPRVREWNWAFIGRLWFPQRMRDNWQVVLWYKGVAGTGKSTMIRAIHSVYDSRDVGIMNNNIEPQFGLMGFVDKFLLVAPEVKATFSLDAAVFQTMASADEISIARKNLDALSLPAWKVPSVYSSNLYPRWVDSSGSIQRRIMSLIFAIAVKKQNACLDQQFRDEIDAFIVRACRTYKQKIQEVGQDSVWDHVPEEFSVARKEVSRQTTELVRFLDDYLVDSLAPTEEGKLADFVEVADLERLFLNRRQTGAERNFRFVDQLETEIGSFHNLSLDRLPEAAKTLIIRKVRLNLKKAQDTRGDPAWVPSRSKYYTEAQMNEILAKTNPVVANETNINAFLLG